MSERLVHWSITLTDPLDAGVLGALVYYATIPMSMTIVAVSAAPSADDAGLTIDINVDGTAAIAALAAADQNVAGTWTSTHFGGANEPVHIAADSVISIDVNSAAAATAVYLNIWYLAGE